MANPFDQFDDQVTANPFDQFDAPAPIPEMTTQGGAIDRKEPDAATSHYQEITQQKTPQFSYTTQPNQPSGIAADGSLGAKLYGAAEAGTGIATGAISAPIAGIAGLGDLATGGNLESATDVIRGAQEALTFEPKTQEGIQAQQAVGEVLEPIGGAIQSTGEFLGDATREATGSWVLGGLAQSIPESVLELVGVKGAGKIAKPKLKIAKSPKAALSQSAPNIKQLRAQASNLYKEIDNAGVTVRKSDYQNLGVKLNNLARQSGYDPNLTPKIKGFLERLQGDFDKKEIRIYDIDQLRKVAQVPANSIENATEAAIGSKIIGTIDDFLDEQGLKISADKGPDVGRKYRQARQLTQRVKKAEVIDEAVFRAGEAASGFENGLRNEVRSILKSKKKRRGFTPDEIKAMQQITQGGTMENLFKKVGKLGYGADQQTNMLLGVLGAGAGGAAFGLPGIALTPAIGQVSANIAKKLGAKNAKFLSEVVRAGKNGYEVTEAYIKNIPKRLQTPEELSVLLADPSVDATAIKELATKYKGNKQLIEDAEFLTRKLRQAQLTGALAAQTVDSEE